MAAQHPDTPEAAPRLETASGESWPLLRSCSLGRSTANQIVLPDTKVSRRHALIHAQGEEEYWLVDLGSSNGTYANGRRVTQPIRLNNGDLITMGDVRLVFRQSTPRGTVNLSALSGATAYEIKTTPCWLLLADIVGSTQLARDWPPEQLSMVVGQWLAEGKEIIERHRGGINKFLGDGFLAFWPQQENTRPAVAEALQALKTLQARAHLPFRVVLHFGEVALGGPASLGEESLMGRDVNAVFRMEKLAGSLQQPRLMSAAAQGQLQSLVPTEEISSHILPGFDQPDRFFSF